MIASMWRSRGRFRSIRASPTPTTAGRHDYHGVTLEGGAPIFGRPVLPGGLHSREGQATETVEWFNAIEDPFDLARERGRDSATPTTPADEAVMYDLPFGHEQRWLSSAPRLVDPGARRLARVVRRLSAVRQLSDADNLGAGSDRHTIHDRRDAPGRLDPSRSAGRPGSRRPHHPEDHRYGGYDVSAFGAPPIGRFGTAARGAIESPGLESLALRTAQAIPAERFARHTGVPRRGDGHQHLQPRRSGRAPNTNVTPTNVSAGRVSRGRRHRRRDPAGRHADRSGWVHEWSGSISGSTQNDRSHSARVRGNDGRCSGVGGVPRARRARARRAPRARRRTARAG